MSRNNRLYSLLATVALLAAICLLTTSAHAQKQPVPPVGPPPTISPDGEPVNTNDTMTLPTDREAKGIINAVKDYIFKKDWDVAARSLQYLLEKQEDSFFLVTRQRPDGKPSYQTRISIRIEANRMIGELPPEGLEVYRQKFGARAKQMLEEGIEKRDPQMLALVAMRYRHTESGVQAIQRLADYYLDRGNYQSACGQYSQLIELLDKEKPEVKKELAPRVYFKAALAFQRLGNSKDADTAKRLWKQVEEMVGEKGLTYGKVTYTVAQLKEEFDRVAQFTARTVAHHAVFRGDPSRTAQGIGGEPFLDPRVQISMTLPQKDYETDPQRSGWISQKNLVADKVNASVKAVEQSKRALMPGFFPIATQNRIIFRTYDGVYSFFVRDDPAKGAKAGDIDWMQPTDGSLHALMHPGMKGTVDSWWTNFRNMYGIQPNMMNESSIYIENAQVGSLSHDGQSVYFIDDIAIPPPPIFMNGFGGMPQWGDSKLTDQVFCNRLWAIELETGNIKWHVGDRKNSGKIPDNLIPGGPGMPRVAVAGPGGPPKPVEPKKDDPPKPFVPPALPNPNAQVFVNAYDELLDSYFLGPPLPLNGKIYALIEIQGEIQLVCINPNKTQKSKTAPSEEGPELVWRQPLGSAQNKLAMDAQRRMQPCHLAYSDGLLICPTNAGAVIAVDVFTQSLAWAFSYKSANANPNDPNMDPRFGGRIRRMDMGMVGTSLSQDHWYTSAPAIVNGRVVFTAQDSGAIECLSLKDGARLWDAPIPRGAKDLYMAGVFNGKVLVVGKDTVKALDLFENGKMVWEKKIGQPSGQGVASSGVYYLPLKHGLNPDDPPEVCAINVDTGEMHHTKSRKRELRDIPGNLIFHDGDVLSQNLWAVSAYPQLQVKLAEMNRRLEKDPKDPVGLAERGELHLDKGERLLAVKDLKAALENKPPAEVRGKVRTKLYEALMELLQKDFAKSEGFLKLFEDLCTNDVDLAEKELRRSNYLCILGKGREDQGRLLEAFDAYLAYGQINSNREMVPSVDDPGTLATPEVWARGRISAMMAKAKPADRQPLEDRLTGEWKTVQATGDLDKIRAFVKLFGSAFAVGRQARLGLAERLITSGRTEDLSEAQIHLNELRSMRDDRELAARATDALARLMIRAGLMEDAIHFFRILNAEFGDVKVRDGQTGAEIYNEVITEKRFLPYLETQRQAWNAKLRGDVAYQRPGPQVTQVAYLEPEGERLPMVQKYRMLLDSNNGNGLWQLRLVDRATGKDAHAIRNLQVGQIGNNSGYSSLAGARMAQVHGNILLLTGQSKILAYDLSTPGEPKKLWELEVSNKIPIGLQQTGSTTDAAGVTWITYVNGTKVRLGVLGLLEASYVCLSTSDGLIALDPLTGKPLWKRETPPNIVLFGDASYVVMVESGDNGLPSRVTAVRASDGVKVDIDDCHDLLQPARKLRTIGRQILVFDDDKAGGKLLRLYDPITGKDTWKQPFAGGAVGLRSIDTELVGVAEPDGTVTILDPKTQKVVTKTKGGENGTDLPGHLSGVQQDAYLLTDADRYYLILNKGAEAGVQSNPGFGNLFRSVRVHGHMYALDRATGDVEWYLAVENQHLMVDQFQEIPAVILTAWSQKFGPNGVGQQGFRVEAFDKRTGMTLLKPEQQNLNNQGPFYAMTIDPKASTVELVRHDVALRIVPTTAPAAGPGPGGPGGNPPAPAQRGVPRAAIRLQMAVPAAIPVAQPPPPPAPPPAAKPADKPAAKPADKPVDKPAEKPAGKPKP